MHLATTFVRYPATTCLLGVCMQAASRSHTIRVGRAGSWQGSNIDAQDFREIGDRRKRGLHGFLLQVL
jgi:hypothetical protein